MTADPYFSHPPSYGRVSNNRPGTILHLQFKSQRELCEAFMRMQEFYESPYSQIRNSYFKRETFEVLYALDHCGVFSYFDDWHGFNIPGNAIRRFFDVFHAHGDPLTDGERRIERLINQIDPHFYIIGTHVDATDTDDAVTHELCHAAWYLDDTYNARARVLVEQFWYRHTRAAKALYRHLRDQGYDDSVMDDEFNAYLSTTPLDWWQDHVGNILARALYEFGEPFRQLAGIKC